MVAVEGVQEATQEAPQTVTMDVTVETVVTVGPCVQWSSRMTGSPLRG